MKLAAIISIPFGIPKSIMSFSSYSVKVGRCTMHPGKFIFFLGPSFALFNTSTITLSALISITLTLKLPSASKIVPPSLTEIGNSL